MSLYERFIWNVVLLYFHAMFDILLNATINQAVRQFAPPVLLFQQFQHFIEIIYTPIALRGYGDCGSN